MRLAVLLLLTSLIYSLSAHALTLKSIECGTGVKDLKIIAPKTDFTAGERVYCLTKLVHIQKPTYIIHRYVFRGHNYDIKLSIKPYKRFRTYSDKLLFAPGIWRFEVLDSSGKLLGEKILKVR